MTDYAVFFDPSRKRWSWIKRISTVFGLLSVIVVSTFLVSVFISTPLLPVIPGITRDLKRTLRRVQFPRHQTRAALFLQRKDRDKLLRDVAVEQARKNALAAKGPVRARHIVAAFYAPWQ